jgi:glycosyltransferase involved in cell wall biosynthesis
MTHHEPPLVHFRTPTYRRFEFLARTLKSMQAQTIQNWICDVYDDDPEGSARAVVDSLNDHRIRWNQNGSRLLVAGNVDRCFTRDNPHGAQWFCVVEDDDYILPAFAEENIRIAKKHEVRIVLRNQLIELASGTPNAALSAYGILDRKFHEGICTPDLLRLAILVDVALSHGGLFWSADVASDLELKFPCNAVLQEYLRALTVVEPFYVAMEPLAVWAKKDAATSRNDGLNVGFLRRELDLKRAIQELRQEIWRCASPAERAGYVHDSRLLYDPRERAKALAKALIRFSAPGVLTLKEEWILRLRGLLIRGAGATTPEVKAFLRGCKDLNRPASGEASSLATTFTMGEVPARATP